MLGLITGSGFYNIDSIQNAEALIVDTPFGAVSLTRGRWKGDREVLFLARHGTDHSVPPHKINYRANIWALQEAGATAVIATAVSGGIAGRLKPGDFVVIDDFIDFTHGRESSYFDVPGELMHTDMTDPYDSQLRATIVEAAASVRVPIIDGGTYCATNGPRFESKAEIKMMRSLGGDLVGMTGCPEVVLANELELDYAAIGVISNPAAGLGKGDVSVDAIMKVLAGTAWPLELLLGAAIDRHAG